MKAWKKGAVIGLIWGILPFILDWLLFVLKIKIPLALGIILGLPAYLAKYYLGFVYVAIFIGSSLVGIIIGAYVGWLFDLRKERQQTGKIEFSYWQKGAILGLFWSLMGFIVIFYYEKILDITRGWSDLILVPMAVLFLVISFPALLGSFFVTMQYFWGFVFGYLFGGLFGHIYSWRQDNVESFNKAAKIMAVIIILVIAGGTINYFSEMMDKEQRVLFKDVKYNGEIYMSGERAEVQGGKSFSEMTHILSKAQIVNLGIVLIPIDNVYLIEDDSSEKLSKLKFYQNPDDPNHIYSKLYRGNGKSTGNYQKWIKKSK